MAVLTVGAGQAFSTLHDAIAASHDGDTIEVMAGTYTNDFATINTKVSIVGVGGMVHLLATEPIPDGKAILVTNADVSLKNIEFSGATVADANGAGVRYQGGNLTIDNCYFHDNQDGLLAAAAPGGNITIRNVEFAHDGTNLSVGEIHQLLVDNSYIHAAAGGQEIRSVADTTTIENSRIDDGSSGTGNYNIDLPKGGAVLLQNDVIEQGPNSDNPAMMHFGTKGAAVYGNSSLQLAGDTIINDLHSRSAVGVLNQSTIVAHLANDQVYGLKASQVASGPNAQSGDTFLSSEPTLDTSSPWSGTSSSPGPAPAPAPPPTSTPVPAPTPAPDPTPASGHVLTVGAGQQFGTLTAAVAAAQDGDTIEVQAGTYTNDFPETITHKITIEGVGGMVHLIATTPPPNDKAILVTKADVTLDHLDFSGVHFSGPLAPPSNQSQNGAGIRYEGGDLTVTNCSFHDSDMGILGAASPGGQITITNSEFWDQNAGGGLAHQLYVGDIAKLTVADCYFHDNDLGHHIKSRADVTDIHDNVIDDGSGTTSYDIDLPTGGVASIRDNTIVKGPNAANSIAISYGEEGNNGLLAAHPAASLDVQHNTIVGLLPSGDVGVRNYSGTQTAYGTATQVTAHVDDNRFYNISSVATGPNEQTGNATLATQPSLQVDSPWSTDPHTLSGAAGNAILVGGGGDDTLYGGPGDTLTGGGGNDTFIIQKGQGSDVITDFQSSPTQHDLLRLIGYGLNDFSAIQPTMTQDGNNVVFNLGGGETVTLENTTIGALSAANVVDPPASGAPLVASGAPSSPSATTAANNLPTVNANPSAIGAADGAAGTVDASAGQRMHDVFNPANDALDLKTIMNAGRHWGESAADRATGAEAAMDHPGTMHEHHHAWHAVALEHVAPSLPHDIAGSVWH